MVGLLFILHCHPRYFGVYSTLLSSLVWYLFCSVVSFGLVSVLFYISILVWLGFILHCPPSYFGVWSTLLFCLDWCLFCIPLQGSLMFFPVLIIWLFSLHFSPGLFLVFMLQCCPFWIGF